MSFRKEVFDLVGKFNTNLGRKGDSLLGGEEKDLFQRIYAKQLKVLYVPDAIVYHSVSNERTTARFIKNQALGTGKSEWQRVKDEGGMAPVIRILQEIIKWIGSVGLFFGYLASAKPAKGIMIIRFRYWVTKGMF